MRSRSAVLVWSPESDSGIVANQQFDCESAAEIRGLDGP